VKFIKELVDGERIESVFAVADKQLRTTRAGKMFLSLKLTDKTGNIDAVVWDNAEALSGKFEKGDFIGIRADVNTYQGANQLTLQQLKKVEKTSEYMARFLATSDRDVDEMMDELKLYAMGIENSKVRELVTGLLEDESFAEGFKRSSAAKAMHHVFAGGLLQHTLKVTRISDLIYKEYAETDAAISAMISRDLLIAGAILHDIGKAVELSPGPVFEYTLKGRLLGHIPIGLMTVKARIDKIDGFPDEAADVLMHMLLSHHGEYEYGSPKRPKCMEAFILHYADNIDASLQGLMEYAGKDNAEGKFTAFHRLHERYFYKGRPDLGEDEE